MFGKSIVKILDELRMNMWQNNPYGSLVQETIKSEFEGEENANV
ncbi:hypothetical protein [Falcatimonas sp. MSJ-15]|nr:hypothetical protein [Falcatimonas sp. MSJ-15]